MKVPEGIGRYGRLPLSYDECRAQFRHAVHDAGLELAVHPIDARGPDGQQLTIDVTHWGLQGADQVLVVLSGVHGVEGFVNSALQCDFVGRSDVSAPPSNTGVLVVHAVNPWGMAWWRRQNESNVDLNRNWRRDEVEPLQNDAYDELHPLACPDTDTMPSAEDLLASAGQMVADRGLAWVRDGITTGQYRHPDGLHFGGDRTEQSTAIVQQLVTEHLSRAQRVFTLDLHTGHGPNGEVTFLSDKGPGDPQDVFLRNAFGADRIEATKDNPDATTGTKSGQIANGVAQLLPDATCFATSVEFGTASDIEQITATYLAHWVWRHGDPAQPAHAAALWDYRCCFTPDDPAWEATALEKGRAFIDQALVAVAAWRA